MQTDCHKNTKTQLGNKPLKTLHVTQVFFHSIILSYLFWRCLLCVILPQLGLRKQEYQRIFIFYTGQSGVQLSASFWMGWNQFSIYNKFLMFQSKKIPVKTPILNSFLKVFCNSELYRLKTLQKHCLSQIPKED